MRRLTFIIVFFLWAIAGRGQQVIPVAIAVPAGSTMVLHVYARGVQVYVCRQDAKDSLRYIWTFQEPRAELFTSSAYTSRIGKHYLNASKMPTWELTDGSVVSGIKLQQAASPDTLAISWLLLHAAARSTNGRLEQVAFIQRLYTHGGTAPARANRTQMGQVLEVSYTAEYLFYR